MLVYQRVMDIVPMTFLSFFPVSTVGHPHGGSVNATVECIFSMSWDPALYETTGV